MAKKVKVTPRQRRAAALVVGNLIADKPKTITGLLIEAGYSEKTAHQQSAVVNSAGFLQCIQNSGVTEEKLSQVLYEGLEATTERARIAGRDEKGHPEYKYVPVKDHNTRHKFLETALKIKGFVKDPNQSGSTYNTYIQQNNLNPNDPENKDLVNKTLDYLMDETAEIKP